jgi:hypothetical protein
MSEEFVSKEEFDKLQGQINGVAAKMGATAKTVESLASLSNLPDLIAKIDSKMTAFTSFQEELQKAIDAPDETPSETKTADPTQNQQNIDEIVARAIAARDKEIAKDRQKEQDRIKALESAFNQEKEEKQRIQAEALASKKKDGAFTTLTKVGAGLNLLPGTERALLLAMREDGILVDSDEADSYQLKVDRQDPITKQTEQVVVSFSDALADVIKGKYTSFIAPRSGVGTSATPTQQANYNTGRPKASDRTEAELMDIFSDPAKEKLYYADLQAEVA